MPIVWHLSRWWNWCIPEDEKKKRQKKYGYKHGPSCDRIQKKFFDQKELKKDKPFSSAFGRRIIQI